jgi:hypothetical protein
MENHYKVLRAGPPYVASLEFDLEVTQACATKTKNLKALSGTGSSVFGLAPKTIKYVL